MGPEGPLPSSTSLQFSDKVPPSFDGYGDYQQYRENMVLWDTMTSVDPQRRAPTIIGQLTGQAQVTAKILPLAHLTSEDGVQCLLKELDKKFGLAPATLLPNNVSEFFAFSWDRQMSVEKYVVGFYIRLDKISKLDMNDDLKGHLLLKQASLDSHDRNLVVGAAGGNHSLQALATSLRKAFRTEGFPASSTHTRKASNKLSSRNGIGTLDEVNRRATSCSSRNHDSASQDPRFYTFNSADNSGESPSAIIDSGACASVVGKSTLDQAISQLRLGKLREERIRQPFHQFGPSEKPIKTLCAVRVPFTCKVDNNEKPVNFGIRFDVVDGKLPFLIGLPSLLAMKATLNFKYDSLSLNIKSISYRLQQARVASHLRLPLVSKIAYHRSIGPSSGRSRMDSRSLGHFNKTSSKCYHSNANQKRKDSITIKKNLNAENLKKVHEKLGRATVTKMRKFIRESKKWNPI